MEVDDDAGPVVVARARQGPDQTVHTAPAFSIDAAYTQYADAVRAYAARYVGADDAEDVVQRTFLDAWRAAGSYDPRQRFTGWLFTIAHHRCVDLLRSRRTSSVDLDAARDLCGEDGRETVERFADAVDVRAALDRMPEHERSVLQLMYFEELTQRETAERLDLPLGTVKARASRGTRRLGELLRESRGGSEGR